MVINTSQSLLSRASTILVALVALVSLGIPETGESLAPLCDDCCSDGCSGDCDCVHHVSPFAALVDAVTLDVAEDKEVTLSERPGSRCPRLDWVRSIDHPPQFFC